MVLALWVCWGRWWERHLRNRHGSDRCRTATIRLQFRGVYTWSKSLDDGTAWNSSVGANVPGFVMYPSQPKWDWGPSNYGVRHLAVIQATYELPVGAGSAIESLQTGIPFTPRNSVLMRRITETAAIRSGPHGIRISPKRS